MSTADTRPLTAAVSLTAIVLIGAALWYGTRTYDVTAAAGTSPDPAAASESYRSLFGRMPVELPKRTFVQSLGPEEKASLLDEVLDQLAQLPPWVVSDPAPLDDTGRPLTDALARGQFSGTGAKRAGAGEALLFSLPDGTHLLRFEDFSVSNGADLHVYLTAGSAAADLESAGMSLGRLRANIGDQNYAVPKDVTISDYSGVAIYCELFDVLFSAAILR